MNAPDRSAHRRCSGRRRPNVIETSAPHDPWVRSNPVEYRLGESRYSSRLAPVALFSLLSPDERPEMVIALCTEQAKSPTLRELEAAMPGIASVHCADIPSGIDTEDVDRFLKLMIDEAERFPDAAVTIDVTHGFRHFSFLMYAGVLYLAALRPVGGSTRSITACWTVPSLSSRRCSNCLDGYTQSRSKTLVGTTMGTSYWPSTLQGRPGKTDPSSGGWSERSISSTATEYVGRAVSSNRFVRSRSGSGPYVSLLPLIQIRLAL